MGISRRQFLAHSLLATAAGRFGGLPLTGRSGFQEIRRNVGTFTARGGTIGWLTNSSGTLLVDSQFPDTAETLLAGLVDRGALPVRTLVNTHHHVDHTGGNAVLRAADVRIVAHRGAAELQRSAAAAAKPPVTPAVAETTFAREWKVEIGDERIVARHHGPAHTAGDAVITFENAAVVHMGDLVFDRVYPFVDRASGASIRGWISILEAVVANHPADAIYVFGHVAEGRPATGGADDVLVQRDLLAAALDEAQRGMAAGASREEIVDRDTLPGFPEHSLLADWLSLGALLGAAHDELLTERPRSAFTTRRTHGLLDGEGS